jgi:lysophospholipase L1-like esterase
MTLPLLHVIGDSISMQYGPYLEAMLRGIYSYSRKPASTSDPDSANGGDSSMVLAYLRERLAQPPKIDLLLANCGLHDIKRNPGAGEPQVPLAAYEDNLRAIIVSGREHGAQVAWVRTTPVVDAVHNSRSASFKRYAEDVARFNAAADRVMAEHGVPSIDLHTFTCNLGPDLFIDRVHFSDAVRVQQAAFIAGRLYSLVS